MPAQSSAAMPSKSSEVEKFAKAAAPSWPLPTREEWQAMSLDDAHALIQQLHASYREGADIVNQKVYDAARESNVYVCMVCRKKKPVSVDNHPNYVWKRDDRDPVTGLYTSTYICSSECFHRGSNDGRLTNAKVRGDVLK